MSGSVCRECLSHVPAGAGRCPQCGAARAASPRRGRRVALGGFALVALIAACGGAWWLANPRDADRGATPGPPASGAGPASDPGDSTFLFAAGPDPAREEARDGAREPASRPDPAGLSPGGWPGALDAPLRSLVFLQLFDRQGELRRETVAVPLGAGRWGVLADDLLGAVRGRGWTLAGRYHAVETVTAFDLDLGLATLTLSGAPGRSLERGALPEDPTVPVYLVVASPAATPVVTAGTHAPGRDGRGHRFEGAADPDGGVVLDRQGRLVGFVPRSPDGTPAGKLLLAPTLEALGAPVDRRSLETLQQDVYAGTARAHVDRALRHLEEDEAVSALSEFLEALRLRADAIEGLELRLAAALLSAIDEARATGAVHRVQLLIEELLATAAAPGVVHLHAGRLYTDVARYALAVEHLLRSLHPGGADEAAVRPWLRRAYLGWARDLRLAGRAGEAERVLIDAVGRLTRDAVLFFELGRARAALGDWEGARYAMEEALALDPGMASIIGPELDEVYRHLGTDGVLTVDIPRDTRLIPVEVFVNRRAHATLFLDSGASWTFITPAFAAQLGIDAGRVSRRGRFSTANGQVELPVVVLREVNFRGFVVADVEAAIGELDGSLGDGVLGNNFLRHFTITIDRPNGKMTFESPR